MGGFQRTNIRTINEKCRKTIPRKKSKKIKKNKTKKIVLNRLFNDQGVPGFSKVCVFAQYGSRVDSQQPAPSTEKIRKTYVLIRKHAKNKKRRKYEKIRFRICS